MLRSNIFKFKYIVIFFATLICCELSAQGHSETIKLYFKQGGETIIDDYNLKRLNLIVDTLLREITTIEIVGYSSSEGSANYNLSLSRLRSEAVREYIVENFDVGNISIEANYRGVAWAKMEHLVKCQGLSYAPEVLPILENTPEQYRNRQLQALDNGSIYQAMLENLYPLLRYAEVTINYNSPQNDTDFAAAVAFAPNAVQRAVVESEEVVTFYVEQHLDAELIVEPEVVPISTGAQLSPLFALKTNLLFDLATLVNFEVEIPIKDRWSIAAEYIFPWWTMDNGEADSRRNRIQLRNGNLEGRYWWGDRALYPTLTGWFSGVYMGLGLYDVEHNARGYQGEFFLAAGLSGGYSHTINRAKNLRLEYSIGIGYLSTTYKYYHAEFCNNNYWHAIEQRSGKYLWFGPTRARVSLSWLINCKERK